MTTNTQVEELRGVVDKLLSMMKVEEYGVVPQSETLNKIMDLFTHQLELAKIESVIEELNDMPHTLSGVGVKSYSNGVMVSIEDRISELTKQKEKLLK